jgi:tRNA nucleotidyltransferase (CCA-adding enzyme)
MPVEQGSLTSTATLIKTARNFVVLNKPPTEDYLSVHSYFKDKGPICDVQSYIYRKEDIITLKPKREDSWVDDILARGLRRFSSRLTRASPSR